VVANGLQRQLFQRLGRWGKLLKQFRDSFTLALHRAEAAVLMKRGSANRLPHYEWCRIRRGHGVR
jgi:hypothetical protein